MSPSPEVTNFTEILVQEEIERMGLDEQLGHDDLQDVFCITMNKLRPHYVRSIVDVRINMSDEEYQSKAQQINGIILSAMQIVSSGRRQEKRMY